MSAWSRDSAYTAGDGWIASAAHQVGLRRRGPGRQPVLHHHGVLVAQLRHRQPRSGGVAGRSGAADRACLGRGHRPAHGHAVRPHGLALGAAAALPAVRFGGDGGRDDAGVPGGGRARLEPRRPVCLGGVRGLRGEHRLYRGFHTLRGAHPGVGARFSGAHQPQRLPHGVGDRRHPARGGSVHHRGGSGGRRRGGSGVHGRRSAVRGDLRGGGADHLRLGARASGDPGPRAGRQRVRRLQGGAEGAPRSAWRCFRGRCS